MTSATGVIQKESDYYPFGGERQVVNTVDLTYKFAGMEYDPETGAYHTLYRQYSPNLGRWFSADPERCGVDNPQAFNMYAYVLDNPTNLVDPLGLQGCNPWDPFCPGLGTPGPCSDPWYATTHAECGPIRVGWNPRADFWDIREAVREARWIALQARELRRCRPKCPAGTKPVLNTVCFIGCLGVGTVAGAGILACAATAAYCLTTGNLAACVSAAIICTVEAVVICACGVACSDCEPKGGTTDSTSGSVRSRVFSASPFGWRRTLMFGSGGP